VPQVQAISRTAHLGYESPSDVVLLTLMVPYPAIRWVCIVAAGFLFIFNAVSVNTYPAFYDKFLIIVGLAFNVLTIWLAATWRTPA